MSDESHAPDGQLTWRVSLGMMQRVVRAEDVWTAARKCGLGSGDLLCAEFEQVDDNGKVIGTVQVSRD